MLVKNKKAIIYIFIIFISIFSIFSQINSGIIKAQNLQELNGDKLTMEPLAESQDQYLILAKGNALLKYNEMTIKGENAEFNTLKGTILFNNNIVFDSANYKMTGNKLTGNINDNKFTISGNSSFSSDNIEAESDKIIYNQSEEMAYLEGDVNGQQNGREFSAEKISIDLSTEKIELSGNAKLIFPDKGE